MWTQQQQQQSTLSKLGITKVTVTVLITLPASLYIVNLSSPTFINFIILPILSVILAMLGAAWAFLHSQPAQILSPIHNQLSSPNLSVPDTLQSRPLYPDSSTNFSLLVSPSFDTQLQSVLDRIIDKYLLPLYSKFGSDRFEFRLTVRRTVWNAFERLAERLIKVDYVTLLTRDLMILFTQHLQLVRTRGISQKSEILDVKKLTSKAHDLHSCLQSYESEIDFIRQITDVFLCICMREEDMRCEPLRILLREFFVNQVIYPAVKVITDPDVINQKIVEVLQAQEKMKKTRDTSYTYARTYEEFIKLINKCSEPEELKRIRYSIMLELMQATAMRNMKYAQESQQDKLAMNMHASKGHRLRERNLHKYINQCRCAITLCEKRLKFLTGEDPVLMNKTDSLPSRNDNLNKSVVKMVYPEGMREILDNVELRAVFLMFLEKREDPPLCHLWLALEELETQAQFYLDNDIHAIIDSFLEPDSQSYVKLMSSKLELFTKFSTSHDPTFLILFKEYIVQELKERFFSQFIESSEYQEFLVLNQLYMKDQPSKHPGQQVKTHKDAIKSNQFIPNERESSVMDSKLNSLYERRDAVSKHLDISSTLTPEDANSLNKAYLELDTEVKEMEHYLSRTSDWIENMGNWCVEISNVEMDPRQYNGANPIFIILVSPKPEDLDSSDVSRGQALGWVIPKTYNDFSELHQILSTICPKIRKDFPVTNPTSRLFQRNSFTLWETQRQILNQYINLVMQEQVLQESEALYSFLSPVSGQFKQTYVFEGRPFLLSLTNVFKNPFSSEDFTEDDSQKEQVAEYMFELIHEVFELDGTLFKWIRRQIISVAHASFGGSIDRQLRLTAVWLVSEPMLVHYLESIQDVLFKDDDLLHSSNRSDEEKTLSKEQAYTLIKTTLPDMFQEVLGSDNTRRGLVKLFGALQDPLLNKHLLYGIIEQLVITCLPEIKQL
ncbi:hypothetical protein LOD99_2431 [Oopsacas minuta]|uniref:Sorting nexin-25 n=1 Tax=Oopsacas minuta TaxID=111878 RepID=A0AAV7K1N7_9METZ|nr:hypothetical protein LOD99_2431 [Oopsacas minuta]